MSEWQRLISMDTAARIWAAHREIATAQKLLVDIEDALQKGEDPTPIDTFGRRRGYQLGVPSGHSGHQLFNVEPRLARQVIEAHIEAQRKELAEACRSASTEMESPS